MSLPPAAPSRRPNIVYIVADDLGYADLGCYGGRPGRFGAVSPQIDALAAGGLRFTQGYANSPVCSPTRFALMTMRWHYRLRGALEEPINSRSQGSTTLGLPPEMPTLPGLLRQAGYRTALVGKWHLGFAPHFGPLKSGYEQFYGVMAGGVDYFSHCSSTGEHDLFDGDTPCHDIGYLTDLITERALRQIDQWAPGAPGAAAEPAPAPAPFFLSLHYTAPHWPWETRDDVHLGTALHRRIAHLDGGNVHTYQRMIHHMDEGIGRLVARLRERDLLQDTLIVFTSDNGGERFSDNWPLTEGGIRVPWVAHWPAGIAPGGVSTQHCLTMDWSATMLALGGGQADAAHPLDGVSLAGVLREPAARFERPMYWRMLHRGQRALRHGDWKYLRVDGYDYLFNLQDDERERANRATREPERLAQMRQQWLDWNAQFPPVPDDAAVSLVSGPADMPSR